MKVKKNEPIRVLIYAVSTNQGGVEEYLLNLYRRLDRSKVQFDFIVSGEGEFYAASEVEALGGELYYMCDASLFKIMRKQRNRHAILYFNVCAWYRPQPLIYAMLFGYDKIIAHAHNTRDSSRSYLLNIPHMANRIIARSIASKCFACSRVAGDWIFGERYFRTNRKCSVIPNAIELNRFSYSDESRLSLRTSLGIPLDALVAIHVGRMTYQKNQEFVLAVFAEYAKQDSASHLIFVGDGESRPLLESETERLGLTSRIHFLGRRRDIPQLFSASDVLLLPSRYEGLVVVGIEAQANGLPIIASDRTTDELDKTGLVDYVGINGADVSKWVQKLGGLVKSKSFNRTESSSKACMILRKNGYDSRALAGRMQELFIKTAGSL